MYPVGTAVTEPCSVLLPQLCRRGLCGALVLRWSARLTNPALLEPRSGLLAPRWRSDARGVIVGLTSYATKAHIVRAMLEAMCFQTREVVDAMRQDADLSHLKVGSVTRRATGYRA